MATSKREPQEREVTGTLRGGGGATQGRAGGGGNCAGRQGPGGGVGQEGVNKGRGWAGLVLKRPRAEVGLRARQGPRGWGGRAGG